MPGGADSAGYALLLSVGYVLFYGWLLAKSDGLPYVMDNNESFSSLWHATNLYHFGLEKSFGLTDEAYGFATAAHPYVYTHQGNFPRLFALLIYAMGARTVESQIIVTTFTVGLLVLLLAFVFLSRISGSRKFAVLACALLFTDYVLIAQWQVVTYRVWHAFFVFATFLCVTELEGPHKRRAFALLALNSLCLFYYELIFATLTATAATLYAGFRNVREPRRALLAAAAIGAGGLISVAILCGQIVLYMGWDNFLKDAFYTFVARNQFAGGEATARVLREFYETHRIVFWYNLFDGASFRTIPHFIASLTFYELQIHTPLFAMILMIPAVAWVGTIARARSIVDRTVLVLPYVLVGGHFLHRFWRAEFGPTQILSLILVSTMLALLWGSRKAFSRRILLTLAGMVVLAGALPSVSDYVSAGAGKRDVFLLVYVFAVASIACLLVGNAWPETPHADKARAPETVITWLVFGLSTFALALIALASPFGVGRRPDEGLLSLEWLGWMDVAIAAATTILVFAWVIRSEAKTRHGVGLALSTGGLVRLRRATAINAVCAAVIVGMPLLFQAKYQPLWSELSRYALPALYPRGLTLLAVFIAHGVMQLAARKDRFDWGGQTLCPVALFVAAGYAAYAIVFTLSPGYIFTGYRFRLTPLTVFFTDVMLAAGIYLIYRLTAAIASAQGWPSPRRWAAAAAGTILLYWANVQLAYVFFLPPDHLGILKALSKPPFKGTSFIANTYAAPVAAYTRHWAYIDPELAQANIETAGGVRRLKTDDRYLWLADRDTNPEYRRPEHFICLMPQSLHSVLAKINAERGTGDGYAGCDAMPLVRYASSARQDAIPRADVLLADSTGRSRFGHASWAILKLHWVP